MRPSRTSVLSGPSRLTIFALLYAWANILHQLSFPEWVKAPHLIGWLLFISSGALALKPDSVRLLLSTLVLRLAFTLDWMPMIREHLFLEGLFTAGILIALILKAREIRQYHHFAVEQQDALFESFAPFLRVTSRADEHRRFGRTHRRGSIRGVPQQPLHRALPLSQGHGELGDGEGVWGALRYRLQWLSLRRCALAVSTDWR